jgi:hypothetical protein
MNGTTSCGCCACLAATAPHLQIENRPGLSALSYRIGTYATFFEAMIRRLSMPADGAVSNYSLHALTTREADDPAIAFLDSWAIVGDVLTFYQERIANEGYLRTATERRSVLELGRLVGYALKPGVSASVYLAYTLDPTAKTIIPKGSKSQTIPGDGEQPQTFETTEDIEARGVWNALAPRLSKPPDITLANAVTIGSIWIKGVSNRISQTDPLLFVFKEGDRKRFAVRSVLSTAIDNEKDRTEVKLEPLSDYFLNIYKAATTLPPPPPDTPDVKPLVGKTAKKPKGKPKKAAAAAEASASATFEEIVDEVIEQIRLGPSIRMMERLGRRLPDAHPVRLAIFPAENKNPPQPEGGGDAAAPARPTLNDIVRQLAQRRAIAPPSQWQFGRDLNAALAQSSDFLPRLTATFLPRAADVLYTALAFVAFGQRPLAELESVHILRRRANVFGYNAPAVLYEDRPSDDDGLPKITFVTEQPNELYLDTPDEAIRTGSYAVIRRVDETSASVDPDINNPPLITLVRSVTDVEQRPRGAYGISAKSTRLTFDDQWTDWLPNAKDPKTPSIANLAIIRSASVLAESEELPLAQQPVTRDIGEPAPKGDLIGESTTRIELDAVVDGLVPGRWVIVTGERADTPGTAGVLASELAMIENVELVQNAGAGGTPHSIVVFAPEGLRYRYKRSTVKIYANIAKADHGETRNQILGGGNAAVKMQTFTLQHAPLTFTAAPTIAGVVSTLAVRVNDVLWHETDSFIDAPPDAHVFVSKIADDGKVSVIFGNGREGALLPTGTDNVRAAYRSGIGYAGNARARQIATAISRPLGVTDVINPLPASGGVDPESRDDARRSIPVSLQTLGRIVSVQDFADFARTFAGISKAAAVALSDGRRRLVHLTIGGTRDVDIDVNSDLFHNLVEALRKFGDPYQPFVVQPREKLVIAGSANVRVHPDYLWATVAPRIRETLLGVFSFDRRDFGQVVFPAEIVAAIQNVAGVAYVDLDTLGSIAQQEIIDLGPNPQTPGFLTKEIKDVKPIVPELARSENDELRPAQIAYLPPELADLFVLTEIPNEP